MGKLWLIVFFGFLVIAAIEATYVAEIASRALEALP